jgi:NAD(P)H dehydrogenase (quinone)
MSGANVLVVFYSRTGVTETLALAAGVGAVHAGASIRLRRIRDSADAKTIAAHAAWVENRDRMNKEYSPPTAADVAWANAIILAAPHGFDASSAEVSDFLRIMRSFSTDGKLANKIAGAFDSTSLGAENNPTLASVLSALGATGLIVVPSGSDANDSEETGETQKPLPAHSPEIALAQNYGRALALKADALTASK